MELPVRCGSKLEVRAVVFFFAVQGGGLVEIYRLIRETYGDECPVITIRFANQMVNLNRFFPPARQKNERLRTSNLDPQRTGSSIFAILPRVLEHC